jgi:hypothetical protein
VLSVLVDEDGFHERVLAVHPFVKAIFVEVVRKACGD